MMNMKRIVIINAILLIILLGAGVGGYYYFYQTTNFIKTDNAAISGNAISIVSPVAGKLISWDGSVGKSFNAEEKVGEVFDGKTSVPITVPVSSTIVQDSAVKNSFVAPGVPVARAYDLNHLWVTANIEETKISDIKIGQDVDVYVDAFPDSTFSGKISKLGYTTAGTFSLLPSSNTTGNYTKVTQVIPVTISLDGYKGDSLAPGMSATIRIHK